jgi:hypothetical protein
MNVEFNAVSDRVVNKRAIELFDRVRKQRIERLDGISEVSTGLSLVTI